MENKNISLFVEDLTIVLSMNHVTIKVCNCVRSTYVKKNGDKRPTVRQLWLFNFTFKLKFGRQFTKAPLSIGKQMRLCGNCGCNC